MKWGTNLIYKALVCLDEIVVESIIAKVADGQCIRHIVDPEEDREQRVGGVPWHICIVDVVG